MLSVSNSKSVSSDCKDNDPRIYSLDKINYLNSPSNRRGNNELEGADEEIAQDEEAAEDEEEELNAEMLDNGEQEEDKQASEQEEEQ